MLVILEDLIQLIKNTICYIDFIINIFTSVSHKIYIVLFIIISHHHYHQHNKMENFRTSNLTLPTQASQPVAEAYTTRDLGSLLCNSTTVRPVLVGFDEPFGNKFLARWHSSKIIWAFDWMNLMKILFLF